MAQGGSRAVQQRRLRNELRRLREEAKRTQKQVAESLGWSISKVIRIETGAVHASTADVRALLHYYQLTDQARTDDLLSITQAKDETWWDEYRKDFKQTFLDFLDYEDSSIRLRQFMGTVVPGLLQTEEYSRAVFQLYQYDEKTLERAVRIRMRRQQLLAPERDLPIWYILDESVLHRWIGGPDVARRQLLRLKEAAKQPNITIRVVPFRAGMHAGLHGDFTIFELPADDEDYVLLLQAPHRDEIIRDDRAITSRFVEYFYALEDIATPADELDDFLDPLIDGIRLDM